MRAAALGVTLLALDTPGGPTMRNLLMALLLISSPVLADEPGHLVDAGDPDETPAQRAADRRQETETQRIVLSARLCVFEIGRRHPDKDSETPETWAKLIAFTRQQLREIRRGPMSCRAKWVRRAMACLGSVYGEFNTSLACVHRPLWHLTLTDQALPMLDIPRKPDADPMDETRAGIRAEVDAVSK